MHKLTRLFLIATVLLFCYCLVLIANMIPLGWVALILLVVVCYRKRGQLHAFGTARWADPSDMRHMINGGNGLIVGYIDGKRGRLAATKALFDSSIPTHIASQDFLHAFKQKPHLQLVKLNKAVHTAVFAPTGVGKGVSIVIPYLMTCQDSMVVVDFKGELAQITADARRKMGHKVVILDPWKVATQNPDTLNVLDCIVEDDPNGLDECRSLASAMVIRDQEKGDGVHFLDNAEAGIAAILAMVVRCGLSNARSLQMLCELVSSPNNWTNSIETMSKRTDDWDGLLARMAETLKHLKDRELASTMTTINRFLRFLSTPAVVASTTASTFDPADLLKKKMTVYLVIPPERMTANSALLRLWIGSMLRAVVRGGLQEKKKVQFILDEAASLGPMNEITDAVDKYRGYGVRLTFLFQSFGQIKKVFPDQEQTLLSNVSTVWFGVNDNETAKYVSERLGKETIVVTSGGTGTSTSHQGGSGGAGSSSYSTSTNDNWQQSGRELAQASEIMNWSERIAVTFTPGVPPIWTTLVRYYDAGFKALVRKSGNGSKSFFEALCFLLIMGLLAAGLTFVTIEKASPMHGQRAVQQQFFK